MKAIRERAKKAVEQVKAMPAKADGTRRRMTKSLGDVMAALNLKAVKREYVECLQIPKVISEVFRNYCDSTSCRLDAAGLSRFLTEHQGWIEATKHDAREILARYLGEGNVKQGLTEEDFLKLLLLPHVHQPWNQVAVTDDMSQPLSHYFISTGHNSYLTGNQLTSESSVEPLKEALLRGVRVLELDLWPSGDNSKIIVYHGRTLTKPVDFEDCIDAIKEHAFTTSEFPVIVTLEVHLQPALQAKAAQIIKAKLGAMLFTHADRGALALPQLPSPQQLRHRILFSCKTTQQAVHWGTAAEVPSRKNSATEATAAEPPADVTTDGNTNGSTNGSAALPAQERRDSVDSEDDSDDMEEAFAAVICIRQAKAKGPDKGRALQEANKKRDTDPPMRLSLNEQLVARLTTTHAADLMCFTQHHLLRVYPTGGRIDSSNFNPMPALLHGAQMVAMNRQGVGRSLWLYDGFFQANGGCGYVKKPDFLLEAPPQTRAETPPNGNGGSGPPPEEGGEQAVVTRPTPSYLPQDVQMKLAVHVLLGRGWRRSKLAEKFDKFSPPDFYVQVGVAGAPCDTSRMHKTKVVDNQWEPEFQDCKYDFPLRVPELAVLRLEVYDHDDTDPDDFAGQIAIPVRNLCPGFQAFKLLDKKGMLLETVQLLCLIEVVYNKSEA